MPRPLYDEGFLNAAARRGVPWLTRCSQPHRWCRGRIGLLQPQVGESRWRLPNEWMGNLFEGSVGALEELQQLVRTFSEERDWEQFHTPRNLVLALVGEVGELAAAVQWVPDSELEDQMAAELWEQITQEIADVSIYLLRLADVLGVDLRSAISKKLALNAERYPVEKAKGVATKYTELS